MSEKVTITVKAERKLILPVLPNFLRDEQGSAIAIQDLTQDQLAEIGRQWTEALQRKARDRMGDDIRSINRKLGNLK